MGGGGREPDTRFHLGVDVPGVVRLTWAPGVEIDRDAAEQAVRAVDGLNADGPRPLFVDMTGTTVITRQARQFFTRPMASVTRLALVGRSAVDRVVANFALGVSGTPMPTRYFTSESAATEWLSGADSVV
jgi:hypothetical protein